MPNKITTRKICSKCKLELTDDNKYPSVARYCKSCHNRFSREARKKWEHCHPIEYKAQKLITTVRTCGKTNIKRTDMATMVLNSMGNSCKYCNEILVLDNMSLDHKIPKSRGGSCEMENLEIICKKCNTRKASLTHVEFKSLMGFLNKQNKDFKNIVLARMAMGGMLYNRRD